MGGRLDVPAMPRVDDGPAGNARKAQFLDSFSWAQCNDAAKACGHVDVARRGANGHRAFSDAAARSCGAGMALRRGTGLPRGVHQMGGPRLPVHLPILISKGNSTL